MKSVRGGSVGVGVLAIVAVAAGAGVEVGKPGAAEGEGWITGRVDVLWAGAAVGAQAQVNRIRMSTMIRWIFCMMSFR